METLTNAAPAGCLPAGSGDAPTPRTLVVEPWPDPVIDALGHDPRSAYVETFWLGILGPSTTWLLRRLAGALEQAGGRFDLEVSEATRALGLGGRSGRNSPFWRSIERLQRFELARTAPSGVLAVRRKIPPLNRRQVAHLPLSLQERHRALQEGTRDGGRSAERSRRLALSLVHLGETHRDVERQLLRWRFEPAIAAAATAWAWGHRGSADPGDQPVPPAGGPPLP